ncbi:uncharacterized protein [Miscanthus floridulus]|uniref:uncharacterized protein n=1 Tax=Miscanthus floridulus TaxID=154761 RepID=UPI00345822D8
MSIVPGGGSGSGDGARGSGEAHQEVVLPEESTSATEPTAAEAAKLTAKDKKVKAHLLQCIPDDILMQVAKKKTGKEVWDSLKARFVGADRVRDARLQMLKSEFDAVEMKEDESLDQVVGKLTALSVRSSSLGGSIGDSDLVKKLFDTVPDRYLTVVAGIEQFYDLKTLAFDEAVGRLKAFEERIRRGSSGSRSVKGQVLLTQAEWEARQKNADGDFSGKGKRGDRSWRGRGRGRGGSSSGRGGGADVGRDGNLKRDKSHIKCFKCHSYGHYANRCPGEKKKEEAHYAKAEEKEHSVLLAETALPGQLQYSSDNRAPRVLLKEAGTVPELCLAEGGNPTGNIWYLDNGASNHMTGDLQKFKDLDHGITCKVRLRSNLISLGQLIEIGHKILLDENELEVVEKQSDRLIMKVPRTVNMMYKIELNTVEPIRDLKLMLVKGESTQHSEYTEIYQKENP